jgi:cysteine synthase A
MAAVGNIWDIVGNTPLIEIRSLSRMTGCEIFGKAEFLNPGGSIKDRAAKGIIQAAELNGTLKTGGTIVEGTAGNTGIGLATLGRERGYKIIISMPDNQAPEKYEILKALGAELRLTKPAPFSDESHFFHQAGKITAATPGAIWANQFENTANRDFHFATTGPEIWSQMQGRIDCLTLSVGSGGTFGGVSQFLKSKNHTSTVILADPYGSGMYSYFKTGTIATEGSSVAEGIGIMRLTANFKTGVADDSWRISDQEMIEMFYHLAHEDGLLVGISAALNAYSAYKYGLQHKNQGKRIVTFLCDSGTRYLSRLMNPAWLKEKGLVPRPLQLV